MGETELDKGARIIFLSQEGEIELDINPVEISFTKTEEDYKGVCKWVNQISY